MTEPQFLRDEASAYETAVRASRQDPKARKILLDNYLDENALDAAERYETSEEFRQVKHLLGTPAEGNNILLDCGGGRGLTTRALSRAGFKATLCDSNVGRESGLSAARALQGTPANFDMTQADWEHLPFATARFDIVFCRAALHHAEDIARTLTELSRVLRPGGRLLTLNDHALSRAADLPVFLKNHPFTAFGVAENAHTLAAYRKAFREAGLRILRVTDLLPDDTYLAGYNAPTTLKGKAIAPFLRFQPLRHAWTRFQRWKNIRFPYPGKPISILAMKK